MSFIDWLKTHWFILVALGTAGIAWGQQQERFNSQAKEILRLEAQQLEVKAQGEKISTIKESVVRQEVEIKELNKHIENQNRLLRVLIESNPNAKYKAQQQNL